MSKHSKRICPSKSTGAFGGVRAEKRLIPKATRRKLKAMKHRVPLKVPNV